jgi:hypothetical protein
MSQVCPLAVLLAATAIDVRATICGTKMVCSPLTYC